MPTLPPSFPGPRGHELRGGFSRSSPELPLREGNGPSNSARPPGAHSGGAPLPPPPEETASAGSPARDLLTWPRPAARRLRAGGELWRPAEQLAKCSRRAERPAPRPLGWERGAAPPRGLPSPLRGLPADLPASVRVPRIVALKKLRAHRVPLASESRSRCSARREPASPHYPGSRGRALPADGSQRPRGGAKAQQPRWGRGCAGDGEPETPAPRRKSLRDSRNLKRGRRGEPGRAGFGGGWRAAGGGDATDSKRFG